MPFDDDFDWQRRLLPEVKRILASYLVDEAPREEDTAHNTDLIVLRLATTRVACRLRNFKYIHRYPDEFTIRLSRPSGVPTELAKVLSGWGDYIFYGFANKDETSLAAWLLGNLTVFRLWHHRELWCNRRPGQRCPNGDGSSEFMAYRIDDLPREFVTARQPWRPDEELPF